LLCIDKIIINLLPTRLKSLGQGVVHKEVGSGVEKQGEERSAVSPKKHQFLCKESSVSFHQNTFDSVSDDKGTL